MRFWIDDEAVRKDIETFKTLIPASAAKAGQASLKEFAEKLKARLIELIPDKGGWYDMYKNSIELVEISPDAYELTTTINEITFGKIEADSSYVWLSGSDEVAAILSSYNPWTLDTIPAVKGGIEADILVRPAGESEVERLRTKQLSQRSSIVRLLDRAGAKVYPLDAELPKIKGAVKADVPFLARRLEYGLGGFPRTPVWTRLDAESGTISKHPDVTKAGDNQFDAELSKYRE